jgi:hypothetical protein
VEGGGSVRCAQGLQGAQFVQCDIFDSAALATALEGTPPHPYPNHHPTPITTGHGCRRRLVVRRERSGYVSVTTHARLVGCKRAGVNMRPARNRGARLWKRIRRSAKSPGGVFLSLSCSSTVATSVYLHGTHIK